KVQVQGPPADLKARYGTSLIRCLPRSPEVRQKLLEKYPEAQRLSGDRLGIVVRDQAMIDAFLSEFRSSLKQDLIDEPSVESAVLAITGREMREQDQVNSKARGKRNKRI